MSARIAAALVALLVVLGGSALLYRQQQDEAQAPNAALLGQPLLKDLPAAKIAKIRIVAPRRSLTLALKDGRWTIAERNGFPADFNKVRGFVLKAIELKIAQSEPIDAGDRARLDLADPGKDGAATEVVFEGADGGKLASFLVGKKYFKSPPADPDKAQGDGRFVMRPGEPATAYVVADALEQASADSAKWIDTTAFTADRVKTLEVRHPGGTGWKIERTHEDSNWKLVGAKRGEKLDSSRANSAAYDLQSLSLADIAPPGTTPAESGLDRPIVVRATTLDGLDFTVKLGKVAGENQYATFTVGGTLVKKRQPAPGEKPADRERRDKDFAERIAKIEARLPQERALSAYTLLIPKFKFEDLLKPRAELLEKKEAKKS